MVVVGTQWDQRMQRWTKAGPCPTTSHFSDRSERTHERGLDLGLQRHHLAPHWAKQKGQSSRIHWNPSQGPPNNHGLLTTLAIHRPWLIWETHACFSIQFPPSFFYLTESLKLFHFSKLMPHIRCGQALNADFMYIKGLYYPENHVLRVSDMLRWVPDRNKW